MPRNFPPDFTRDRPFTVSELASNTRTTAEEFADTPERAIRRYVFLRWLFINVQEQAEMNASAKLLRQTLESDQVRLHNTKVY